MSLIRQIGIFIVFGFIGILEIKAQDPTFSQFYNAPVYMNPAYTGTTYKPKFHINFRDQWPGISHAFISMAVSYDQFISSMSSGLGLLVSSDRAGSGIYNTNTFMASYSYQLILGEYLAMKVGFQGGIYQKYLDPYKIIYGDQINPLDGLTDAGNNPNPTSESPLNTTAITNPDFNMGILIFSNNWLLGASAHHLAAPNESFTGKIEALPLKVTVHAGCLLFLVDKPYKKVLLSPQALYSQQSYIQQVTAGASLKYEKLLGGLWARHNIKNMDALIGMVGYQFEAIRLAYSYDLTLSKLSSKSGGAHEISISLSFDRDSFLKKFKGKNLRCPPTAL